MVLIQNYNEVKRKKTIYIILMTISLSLISCTKSVETINTTSESSYSSNDNASLEESTTKPSSNSNEQNGKVQHHYMFPMVELK